MSDDDQDLVHVARPSISEQARENVMDVLDSGQLTMGPYTDALEERWADRCDTDHAVAVANGTAALHLTLEAYGIGEGDRVVVPALTFGATVEAVLHTGATPVFCDIDRDTYTLDPEAVDLLMHDLPVGAVDAVIPVHLYGHPADMTRLNDVVASASGRDATIIEDASQAHGATLDGTPAGALGDAAAFSMYATKNVTAGEGGLITTDDTEVAERIRCLRTHGMTDRDTHAEVGYNYRMSELEAALACAQVDRLHSMNADRRRHSEALFEVVGDLEWARPATVRDTVRHAYFWAPVEVASHLDGKRVWEELMELGVETRHRYTTPLYEQPAFAQDAACPVAEHVAGQVIGLPNHPELTLDELDRVKKVLRAYDP